MTDIPPEDIAKSNPEYQGKIQSSAVRRAARRRALGLCPKCGMKAKVGVNRSGKPFTHCEKHTANNVRYVTKHRKKKSNGAG